MNQINPMPIITESQLQAGIQAGRRERSQAFHLALRAVWKKVQALSARDSSAKRRPAIAITPQVCGVQQS